MSVTRAMVFAAGLGSRMRPLTDTMPKPLIPIQGKPMLGRVLDKLQASGIKEVVINSCYLSNCIADYLDTFSSDLSIYHSIEDTRLETGGGIVNVLDRFHGEPFFTLNGDIVWTDDDVPALQRLQQGFESSTMDAFMLLSPLDKAHGYDGKGDFSMANDAQLLSLEKGMPSYVYTGVQIVSPSWFHDESCRPFSMIADCMRPKALRYGVYERMYGLVHHGQWYHIGTPGMVEKMAQFSLD